MHRFRGGAKAVCRPQRPCARATQPVAACAQGGKNRSLAPGRPPGLAEPSGPWRFSGRAWAFRPKDRQGPICHDMSGAAPCILARAPSDAAGGRARAAPAMRAAARCHAASAPPARAPRLVGVGTPGAQAMGVVVLHREGHRHGALPMGGGGGKRLRGGGNRWQIGGLSRTRVRAAEKTKSSQGPGTGEMPRGRIRESSNSIFPRTDTEAEHRFLAS